MKRIETDVLIIGSGFGAAAPALRLSEAGFDVTVLEKGPHIDARRDFRQTQDPKYILRFLKSLAGDNVSLTYAEGLGGGSGFYEMVSLRAPSLVFEQTNRKGERLWPAGIDRRTLDPFYDVAERMLNVEQIQPHEVPKSGLVFSLMMKKLGYSCDRARYAVRGCLGSGRCVTGCIYGAKQSLHLNYIPQAVAGGAKFETGVEAISIRTLCEVRRTARGGKLSRIPHRYAVTCRRAESGELSRYEAKLLILAGGTVGTASLLLRSKADLRFLSSEVGQNICFNGSVKAAGLLPEGFPEGDMFIGRSHPGMISYHFLPTHGITISAAKPLPLQAVAAARLRLDGDEREPAYWGAANVELMKLYRRRVIVLFALGLTPPAACLRLVNGRPQISLALTRSLRSYRMAVKELLHSIMRKNGCRIIDAEFLKGDGTPHEDIHFSTTHHVGSCGMADSKEAGVLDSSGEVYDYPGMYVSDGAAIPSSLAVNTSLTILANAERVAVGLVGRYYPS